MDKITVHNIGLAPFYFDIDMLVLRTCADNQGKKNGASPQPLCAIFNYINDG